MRQTRALILIIVAVISAAGFLLSVHQRLKALDERIDRVSRVAERAVPKGKKAPAGVEERLNQLEEELKALAPLKKIASDEMVARLSAPAEAKPAAADVEAAVSKKVGEALKAFASQKVEPMVEKKLEEVLSKMKPEKGAAAADIARLNARLDAVSRELEGLKGSVEAAAKASQQAGADAAKKYDELSAKLSTLSQQLASTQKDTKELATKAEALDKKLQQLDARTRKALEVATASARRDIIFTGVLDLKKDGNDIKKKLKETKGFQRNFNRIFEVDPKTGRIRPRKGYRVIYFVSPASVTVPRKKWFELPEDRNITCYVDTNGIVTCAGSSKDRTIEGSVSFIVIARYVGQSK